VKNLKQILRVLTIVLLFGSLSACASIKPWEREYLAHDAMLFDSDPLETSWRLHVEEVLEGGRGGYSGSGGGCGCR